MLPEAPYLIYTTTLGFQSPILRDSWCYTGRSAGRSSWMSAFSPLFYGIRDVTWIYYIYIKHSSCLSVPYFTGFVMLRALSLVPSLVISSLSVPYFTGFVMLQSTSYRKSWAFASLSVPYFTGFVMLPHACDHSEVFEGLSVPYFTGFVMLLKQGEPGYDTFFSAFSPLFYGIRDVTDNNGACNTPGHRTFSPLFYGIRDVTENAASAN